MISTFCFCSFILLFKINSFEVLLIVRIILNLYGSHLAEEFGKFRDLIVEAKDKGVEIAAAVAKQMLDKNVFIFGAVDFNEASATKELNQLTELQNARVRFAYDKYVVLPLSFGGLIVSLNNFLVM